MPYSRDFTRVQILEYSIISPPEFCYIIPTQAIPADLRRTGSRFRLVLRHIRPEASDSGEAFREAVANSFTVYRTADPNSATDAEPSAD